MNQRKIPHVVTVPTQPVKPLKRNIENLSKGGEKYTGVRFEIKWKQNSVPLKLRGRLSVAVFHIDHRAAGEV